VSQQRQQNLINYPSAVLVASGAEQDSVTYQNEEEACNCWENLTGQLSTAAGRFNDVALHIVCAGPEQGCHVCQFFIVGLTD